MSNRRAIAGLFFVFAASVGVASVANAGIDNVIPSSASVAPGEVIQFVIDNGMNCWKSESIPLAAPVNQWSVSDASSAVVIGPTDILGTEFVARSGVLTVSVTAPSTSGNYTFNLLTVTCAGDTQSFVVTGTATTVAPTTAAPTTAAPTTTLAAAVPAPTTTLAAAVPAPTTTAATAPSALPATGQDASLALVALALCLGGGGLVVATRRR